MNMHWSVFNESGIELDSKDCFLGNSLSKLMELESSNKISLTINTNSFDDCFSKNEAIKIAKELDKYLNHDEDDFYMIFDMLMEQYGYTNDATMIILMIKEVKEWFYDGFIEDYLYNYFSSEYTGDAEILLKHLTNKNDFFKSLNHSNNYYIDLDGRLFLNKG